ncbi:MAG: hypothetical protein K9K35_10515 [Rhodoferax sp.]|nr:hypothetical protein [Rhodoferax sp.]
MKAEPLNQDINYLQGQIQGLQALVLAIANLTVGPEEFRDEGLVRIQAERDAAVALPIAERTLAGIDASAAWLLSVTQ